MFGAVEHDVLVRLVRNQPQPPFPADRGEGFEVAWISVVAGAAALGVTDRIMLYPPQTQRRLADFYSAADVVLVPSRSESFGLVALEAQACGTPVIAASVGGLRYVVEDGVGGYLVEGHDPADHADRLIQILRSPDVQAELGSSGARQALRFTWDATAGELHNVYRELLSARA